MYGKPASGEENFILEHLINPDLTMIGDLKHNELHLLSQRGLGSSYLQDVKGAAGEEFFKHEYPIQ